MLTSQIKQGSVSAQSFLDVVQRCLPFWLWTIQEASVTWTQGRALRQIVLVKAMSSLVIHCRIFDLPVFGFHHSEPSLRVPLFTVTIESTVVDVMYKGLPQSLQNHLNRAFPESLFLSSKTAGVPEVTVNCSRLNMLVLAMCVPVAFLQLQQWQMKLQRELSDSPGDVAVMV